VLIAGGGIPQAEIYQSAGSPIEPPDSLQITPASANVIVGGMQHFTAIDNFGYPRQDVTWTVSNPSLATVATDENDAAVLTGLAAGQVTLTANAETASAQEQVTILAAGSYPPGTVIWSAPPVPGFSALQLVQAVPTASGPDLYSTQLSSDGTQSVVQALIADGRQLWQVPLPTLNNNSVPDGAGGLVVTIYDTCTPGQTNPLTVVDLDPVYGQPIWSVSAAGVWVGNHQVFCYGNGYDAPQIAVRGDGVVVISEPTNNGFPPLTVNGLSYPIPPSSNTIGGNTIYPQCCMGPPMVNSDGTIYVEYEVRNVVNNVITSDNLYLQQIDLNGDWPHTLLSSTTQNEALLPGPIVPDGQGGILATWTISPSSGPVPQYPHQAVDVVSGVVGTPYNLPFSPKTVAFGKSPTLVLGESGTAFGAGSSTTTDGTAVDQVVSFVLSSGTPNWTYQGTAGNTLSLIAATAGNGLVAKITDQSGNDTVLTFNSSGMQGQARRSSSRSSLKPIVEAAISGLSNADYYATNGSWLGLIGNNSVAVLGNFILEASAPATRPRGDAQHNGTTDPGLALVGIQDCHKVNQDKTIVARYPSYSLRLPSNLAQEPPCSTDASQCYTVFEYIPQNQTGCGPAGYNNLNPCNYTNGASPPFNEFDDEITAGNSGAFNKTQYFDYGIPNQRLWGVKQIYSTFSGSPQRKQPNAVFNQLHADPAADPLIDGNLDPWLAPWDGTVASCHSCNSQWFNTCP
jgi:Big-like domain-containing protein